jgi:Uma2 family endonuclease
LPREVERETTIRLDARNRLEPDLLVTTAPFDPDRTWYEPDDVQLVVEVVSPESAHRDRTVKLRRYADAGIRQYWYVEKEHKAAVVHVYERDGPTQTHRQVSPQHPACAPTRSLSTWSRDLDLVPLHEYPASSDGPSPAGTGE